MTNQTVAPVARSNVLPFVIPAAVEAAKGSRRRGKRIAGDVLKFTGKKRYNYDHNECTKTWQAALLKSAGDLYTRCLEGDVSGLMVVYSTGEPAPRSAMFDVLGRFVDDPDYAEYILGRAMDNLGGVIDDRKKMQEAGQ